MDLDTDACYRALLTRDGRFDGRLFAGVRTTGVYCRPVCPARTPNRENVHFFESAAAAREAGFRPCLRCRPEAAPDLAIWRGTSNTVTRALSLIEAGALDDGDVNGLAERLGVGDRQLRRLFARHLGASPVAVAQTRRVHLAKQLLHETKLPMTEVALAAGFGSVRRFNELWKKLYGRPPESLRRTASAVSSTASGEVVLSLPYRPPYAWDGMLAFLAARAIPGVESVNGSVYARSIEVSGQKGAIFVAPAKGASLRVCIRFPTLAALPVIIARVRRVFDLMADPVRIDAHLGEDSLLAPLVKARPGLRVPGAWDGFELGVRAILGQQITIAAAKRLAERLVHSYGPRLEDGRANDAGLTHLFPSAAALARRDLSSLPMPQSRREALVAFALAVEADGALLSDARELEVALRALRALPGIGEWTAEYIAMRQLHEPDAFPADDVALLRATFGTTAKRPRGSGLRERAEGWRPWRAYAAVHLWASLSEPLPPSSSPKERPNP